MNNFLSSLAFALLYIALDAASFIRPLHGLNITPWNPAPALGLVYLFRKGREGWLVVLATVLLSELLIRGVPQTWWSTVASASILGLGYILLGEILRQRIPLTHLIGEGNSLAAWVMPIAIGTLLLSLTYITSLYLFNLLPPDGWQMAVLQFWVGDGVGIVVALPLFLWLSSVRGRELLATALLRWETLGYTILSLIAIYLSFDIGIDSGFKPFYLLFLPIIWAAARQGMSGAIISATLLQLELIIAMQTLGHAEISLPELQMLSLVMALIGFFIGGVVDEQRRTSEELRQSLRMAAAGEMAGALAHELNQPLTALSAYAAACEILINRGERGELLDQALRGMALESARSGQVVRRLRDFFRTGDTKLESVTLKEIICPVVSQYQEKGQQNNIRLEVGALPALKLLVDRLQIQVVLRNLLANAFEAVSDLTQPSRLVTVRCKTLSDAQVAITVQDNGPGLSKHAAESLFKPFHSTKSSGLGLGLVISRAIAETHGGSLAGIVADHGMFTLILPTHENKNHV